jgi:hypothetical protein
MRRQRRLGAHDAALAFEAFQQRGLLAADVGAGADRALEIEARPEPQHVGAEQPAPVARAIAARIVRRRAGIRSGCRCSPWWRRRRCRRSPCLRSARTGRPPSACGRRRCRCRLRRRCRRCISARPRRAHGLPLDAGRETAPPRPRRPESSTSRRRRRRHRQRLAQAGPAAVRLVVGQRQRVGDACCAHSASVANGSTATCARWQARWRAI